MRSDIRARINTFDGIIVRRKILNFGARATLMKVALVPSVPLAGGRVEAVLVQGLLFAQ